MASEAVKRQRLARRRMFRRTMVASFALFLAVFSLMAGQMALGHDPAVGAKKPEPPAQVAQASRGGSWKEAAGQAVGAVIGSVISEAVEGDGDDDERGSSPVQPPQSAPVQSAPAPVQSGAS